MHSFGLDTQNSQIIESCLRHAGPEKALYALQARERTVGSAVGNRHGFVYPERDLYVGKNVLHIASPDILAKIIDLSSLLFSLVHKLFQM